MVTPLPTSACVEPGLGNDPATRVVELEFVCYRAVASESFAEEAGAVSCVDVCYVDHATQTPVCPADGWCAPGASDPASGPTTTDDSSFLVYRAPISPTRATLGSAPAAAFDDLASARLGAGMSVVVKLTGQRPGEPASKDRAYFVRVNREAASQAASKGIVVGPEILAKTTRFKLWASPSTASTGAPYSFFGLNPCIVGTQVTLDGAPGGPRGCLRRDVAEYAAQFSEGFATSVQDRFQAQLSPADRHKFWANGDDGAGGCLQLPLHVYNKPEATSAGDRWLRQELADTVDPPGAPIVGNHVARRYMGNKLSHEPMHAFMYRVRLDLSPKVNLEDVPWTSESIPDIMVDRTCVKLPSGIDPDPTRPCWSGITTESPPGTPLAPTVQQLRGSPYLRNYAIQPHRDAMRVPYGGGGFLQYLAEQFSYPAGSLAHPASMVSSIPRLGPTTPAMLGGRQSDEGFDLIGDYVQYASTSNGSKDYLTLLDETLVSHVGRSFADMMFDFHTALYLKDYNADPADGNHARWRFEWVGNGAAPAPLDASKPFAVTADPLVDRQPDGQLRTWRVLDPEVECTSTEPYAVCKRRPSPKVFGVAAPADVPTFTRVDPNGLFPPVPTGDGDGAWCAAPEALDLAKRRSSGAYVPKVFALALGPDADFTALKEIAGVTGGTLAYVPDTSEGVTQALMRFQGASSAVGASNLARGTQRLVASASAGLFAFPVVSGDRELRVSAIHGGVAGVLVDPSGAVVTPDELATAGRGRVLVVHDPAPGTWGLRGAADFVEAAVESRRRIFAEVGGVPTGLPGEPDVNKLAKAQLRVTVVDDAAMMGCQVGAFVRRPDGSVWAGALRDDLAGGPADGVYGVDFATFRVPGVYNVVFGAICPTPTGDVWRTTDRSFVIGGGEELDADGDGMPDAWERLHALSWQDASDATGDADGDGLSNRDEFLAGTSPRKSDSDGGGESDATEVAAGRDPLQRDDDAAHAPSLSAIVGNGVAVLTLGASFPETTLELRQTDASGAPQATTPFERREGLALVTGLTNGVTSCFEARLSTEAGVSGWSERVCVTPALDPHPPALGEALAVVAHSRALDLQLSISEPRQLERWSGVFAGLVAPSLGTVATPVNEVRIGRRADTTDGAWQPIHGARLPSAPMGTYWMMVRDGAGNVSNVAALSLKLTPASLLDRAIAREEEAQDEAAAGHYAAARRDVEASLPLLARALVRARQGCHPSRLAHLLQGVGRITAHKAGAIAWMTPRRHVDGERELSLALELERELAAWADANGVSFEAP